MTLIPVSLEKYRVIIIVAIAMLVGITYQLFIDIYLPAMPIMSKYFNINHDLIQRTMTIYLLSNGIAVLIFGFMSELWGRRKLMMSGLMVCLIGLILNIYTDNIYIFLLGRMLQGAGLGASILAVPVFMDTIKGRNLVIVFTIYEAIYSSVPIIAPFIGGLVLKNQDWRVIFLYLTFYLIFVLVLMILCIPETLAKHNRTTFNHLFIKGVDVLKNKQFMGLTMIMIASWGGLVVYNLLGPFVFEDTFHFTGFQYGIITLLIGIFYTVGALSNSIFLLKIFSAITIMRASIITLCILSLILLIIILNIKSWILAFIMLSLISLTGGFLFINCITLTLSLFPHISGIANSLQGSICVLSWSFITYLSSFVMPTLFNLAFIIFILSILSLIIWLYLNSKITIIIPKNIQE